ncbi:MAG: hypothetical protein ACRD4O_10260 [Bryobacteraceae bacterium]
MLEHSIQWMNMAETVLEGLLLCRVLLLRLHRPYTFITLYCLLSVFFDSISWCAGWTTDAAQQAGAVQGFFFALLVPLAAWEVFDEIAPRAAKWRRLELGRLVSGVLLTLVFTLIVFTNVDVRDNHGDSVALSLAALLCWAGCASASLAFLWYTRRILRAQKIEFAPNTSVWTLFFMLSNAVTVVYCLFVLLGPAVSGTVSSSGIVLLQCADAAIVIWCICKLKRTAAVVSAVSAKEEQ